MDFNTTTCDRSYVVVQRYIYVALLSQTYKFHLLQVKFSLFTLDSDNSLSLICTRALLAYIGVLLVALLLGGETQSGV